LPLTYGVNWTLNRIYPYRVSVEGERQGMDLHELGAGAYPEFITHTEDFLPRYTKLLPLWGYVSDPSIPKAIRIFNPCHLFFEFALFRGKPQTP
jgi:hypothetical protein